MDATINKTTEKNSPRNFLILVSAILFTTGTAVPLGYNTGIMNSPELILIKWCEETIYYRYNYLLTVEQSINLYASLVSIYVVGGCIGSLIGATMADKFGRKNSLLFCKTLLIIGAMMFYFGRYLRFVEALFVGRILNGIAGGMTLSILPLYLTEISSIKWRGSLGVFVCLGITAGIVVAHTVALEEVLGTELLWHLALSAYAIPTILCFAVGIFLPESPKYLYVVANDKVSACRELGRFHGKTNTVCINQEIEEMDFEVSAAKAQRRTFWSVITDRSLLLPLVLVSVMRGGQQSCGITVIMSYSYHIFLAAGLASSHAKWANFSMGCVDFIAVAIAFYTMKIFNRRPLILISCFASGVFILLFMILIMFVDTVAWIAYICVLTIYIFIFVFQLALGPLPFFIGTELFETSSRPTAMAIGSFVSCATNVISGMTYFPISKLLGSWIFLIYTTICFGLFGFLYRYLPETRGKQMSKIVPLIANGFQSKINA